MAKGVKVEDVLQSMSPGERQEFAKRVKAEGGVDIRLTVPEKGRRRKRKWFVKGRVIGVRVTDAQFERLDNRAKAKGLSVGDYLKLLAFGSHHKGR
ncbi:unnamed protein product [marine sediment metagenome]|uniref:Uncharacterized protein n=1 Tax=marine sediment metagenome TaxID=412755 RepID=X1M909_9ZZZZ